MDKNVTYFGAVRAEEALFFEAYAQDFWLGGCFAMGLPPPQHERVGQMPSFFNFGVYSVIPS
ncbi:protein of unknown function [Legionella fallonii LLAP-10]|uniref:Uncharacterized protein n=1 Tax=Legionella fallonii LLAP-10 TaxID=1212491 RepID=A0A098FZ58_9GAMM|nr:protein of unknown function [Legionella fallonii LLAP-10]